MANSQKGNILYVDDTTSQVDLEKNRLQIKMVILNNASTPASIELQIGNYTTSTVVPLLKLQLSTSELTKVFDFTSEPITFPDGISIPSSGLTSNANATIIFEG